MLSGATAPPPAPLYGGILVGGRSSRMGRPKHMLTLGERTFGEIVLAALRPTCASVWRIGDAEEFAPALRALPRIADAPGGCGPLGGMLAAMRREPRGAWLFAACDLPRLSSDAVAWLAGQRSPRRAAILPVVADGRAEPLLALYEPAARGLLEALAARGALAPSALRAAPGVHLATPPARLRECWRNVNTPEELAAL